MKLTEATRLRLQQLRRRRGEHEPPLTTQQIREEIGLIGAAAEPAAIPALLGFLRGSDDAIATAAAIAIEQTVQRCDPLVLAQLDEVVRHVSEWNWPLVAPAEIPSLSRGLPGVLGVLSCNTSGYLREAAVHQLAKSTDGQELPFLLIRLNDWVRQVREAAKAAITARITPRYAAHWIRCLPLVYRLQEQSRADHRPVAEAVFALLRQPESQDALHQALAADESHTRRLALRLLVETAGPGLMPALELALQSSDTVLRLMAAQELRRRLEGPALQALLLHLYSDRFMPVRREALYGFAEKLPGVATDVLRAALLDPHVSMREAARHYLQQSGAWDFAAFYRTTLIDASGAALGAALSGLGDTGSAADAPRIAEFLTHDQANVRRAAVRALGRLDAEHYIENLLALLQDPSASVAKAARDVLVRHPRLVPPEHLWALLTGARHAHTRRAAIRLIAELGWWDSACLLLSALGLPYPEIREIALDRLRKWQTRTDRLWVQPTRDKVENLAEALTKHGGALDEPLRRDLAAVLSFAQRAFL